MALIECKECGKRISDTTRVCIHCGAPTCVSKPDAVGDSENTQKQSQNGVAHNVENKQKEPEAQAEKTEPRSIFQKLDKNNANWKRNSGRLTRGQKNTVLKTNSAGTF